jgi:hypothetical protein
MQRLGESILEACSILPDLELCAEVEADARRNARNLFKQSVDAYKRVRCSSPPSTPKRGQSRLL